MSSRSARKILAERLIVQRRNREADYRNTWSNTAQFFQNATINTTKYNSWLSPCSFWKSMEAYRCQQELGQWMAQLQIRRQKLAELICEENRQYQEEFENLAERSKSYQKIRTPIQAWKDSSPNETLNDNGKEKIEAAHHRQAAIQELKNQSDLLKVKLELKEKESFELREERTALKQLEKDIHCIEDGISQRQKYSEPGRFILTNHRAFLMRRSALIQNELDYIHHFLERLHETAIDILPSLKKTMYSAVWMQQVIEDQLNVEKKRKIDLEILDTYDVSRLWQIREKEWEVESQDRDYLLNKVFTYYYEELQNFLSSNQHFQRNVLSEREQLLLEIERIASKLSQTEIEAISSNTSDVD